MRLGAPQTLIVRLYNYPAWEVVINGSQTKTSTTSVTGLMVIPAAAGENDIHIYFRRTLDRTVGDMISFISLIVLVALWLAAKRQESELADTVVKTIASPAA